MQRQDSEVLVIQHEGTVGPGNLADWLEHAGIRWRLVEARTGRFPEGDWAAIVVLGSEASVYDDSLDWLNAEKRFLQPLVGRGVPVLGLCFGAQLLAELTGGTVRRAEQTIRGWTAVEAQDALLAGRWLSWHGDEILPPPTGTITARSATCVEAFEVGPHLGLQFHPEVTEGIVENWTEQDFGDREADAREVRTGTAAHLERATDVAGRIYERFFSAALGSRAGGPASQGLER